MIKTFLLVIAMLLGTTFVKAQKHEKLQLVTVKLQKKSQLRLLQAYKFDIAGIEFMKDGGALVDIVVNFQEKWKLRSIGHKTIQQPMSGGVSGKVDKKFKNPKEIELILKKFHAAFPSITKLVSIGKSLEGRDIWGMRITDNPNRSERGEHAVLFNSMHHAREVMSPEVSLDIIEFLLTNYTSSKKVNFWVNNLDIWVVPMLNVDGNAKVWAGNSMWRKNTRNGHGVDLNRNYPFQWAKCNGSSGSKWSDQYRGASPGSEPETKVLMNLVSTIRPVFDISYHTYSNLVIYPMGCQGEYVADRKLIEGIGTKIGKLLDYKPGYGWDLLYSTDGGDIDWMYARWGVIPYVLELTSRSTGFHPPYSKRQETVERNRAGWQFLLDRMFQSGIELDVKGQTGKVLVKIFKSGTDKQLANYEVKKDGTLRMMLTPGIYDIKVKHGESIKVKTVEIASKLVPLRLQL